MSETAAVTAIAPNEIAFMRMLMISLCQLPGVRVWRQNVGSIAFLDARTRQKRVFHAGPPDGAADISGIVAPEGWCLEVEVKSSRRRVTPEQLRWAAFVIRSGAVHAVVRYEGAHDAEWNIARACTIVEDAIRDRRARDHEREGRCPS